MKLKNTLFTLGAIVAFTSSVQAVETAEELYDAKCATCHIKMMPADMSSVVAPALMGVMRHIKMSYPNKDEAVKFMVDYVLDPQKSKAICMPQKIDRFGLMPSQKGNVTQAQLTKITGWMFDNFPPADFRGMGQRRGQGR